MIDDEVEQSVRRIQELIAAIDSVVDPVGRESARALLEVVLDLHALALARMTAMIAALRPSPEGAFESGAALLQRLAEEEPIRAVLLLHGLHPQTVDERVGKAVDGLRPRFAARGLGIKLVTSNAGVARIRVRWLSDTPGCDTPARRDATTLREQIEAAVIEAAPDLETLEIEGLDEMAAVLVE